MLNTQGVPSVKKTDGCDDKFDLYWHRLITCLILIFFARHTIASPNILEDISYSSLPGNQVQVKMRFAKQVEASPTSFTIDNPSRIALDIPNTRIGFDDRNQTIDLGAAHSLNIVESAGQTRLVVNLTRAVPYEVSIIDKLVVLAIKADGKNEIAKIPATNPQALQPSTPPTPATPIPVPATTAPILPLVQIEPKSQTNPAAIPQIPAAMTNHLAEINNLEFRRGADGSGLIIISLSDPNVTANVKEQGNQVVAEFFNIQLPERLNKQLDVSDFGTPVKTIDTSVQGKTVRMLISPSGPYEQMSYQSQNIFTLELRPITKEAETALKKDKFSGERLSLNFQNIEVRAVLQIIADFTGFNLVASDGVAGFVTLRLKNVPWDQALDIVLKAKGLGMRQLGNVLMVAPQQEIAAREKLELETQKQLAELAPLKTEFIQINYAKANNIAALIKADKNNLLTERGSVSIDERTNTLLIQETSSKIEEMRKLIATLDKPVRQVLIESRIVIADQDFSKQLGVKFGYSKNTLGVGKEGFAIGGKQKGDTNYADTPTAFHTDNNENFIVSLPTSNTIDSAALGLAVGKIGSWLLQLELSALQAEGRGEVISNPRVITADQKQAVIQKGVEIPYQLATSSGATAVEFKKAVLGLRVTPQITPDGRVIMDLEVNKDSVGQLFAGVPSINTQNVGTQVLVNNGETVVLGGVYEEENREDVDRVPFLGDLPYFGNLFKRSEVKRNKGELLIFITPKILKESVYD